VSVLSLRVKVIPKSSRSEVAGKMDDGTLKVKVTAAPEKGKANDEVVALLAKHYGVNRSAVEIVRGHTSQLKEVRINL